MYIFSKSYKVLQNIDQIKLGKSVSVRFFFTVIIKIYYICILKSRLQSWEGTKRDW